MEPQQKAGGATKYIVGIIIIALVIVGVSLASRNKGLPNEQEEYGSPTKSEHDVAEKEPAGKSVTAKEMSAVPKAAVLVDYTDLNGFTPDHTTLKVGGTVTFVNNSSGKMWVGSNEHPTHTNYDGTSLMTHCATSAMPSFDQCGDGKTYSFTFTKTGSWNYHNHLRPRMGGTINVK